MLFTDQSLARRLEGADAWGGVECARAHARLYPDSGAASELVAGGYAIFAGVGSPLTHALGLGMSGPVSKAELAQMEDFFQSRGAPATVEMCPLADASLLKFMGSRYRVAEFSSVLIRPLSRRESFPPLNTGVRVRRASPTEVDLWVSTVAQSFHEEGVFPAAKEVFSTLFHMANVTCFLGWVDGEPAGGGAVAVHQGVAMLFGTGTRPAFRKRGVQAALIYSRLALAAVSGCDLAMVTTPPGSVSQRNVERQGFRVVYTRSKMLREQTP
jgi:GNAT superfamily N-acetyltransferase